MAKIVAFAMPLPGHVFSFVGILCELQRRGHHVLLGVGSKRMRRTTIGGVPLLECPAPTGGPVLPMRLRTLAIVDNIRAILMHGETVARTVEWIVSQEEPDFLLVDPMCWGAMVAAEATKIRWGTVAYTPELIAGNNASGPSSTAAGGSSASVSRMGRSAGLMGVLGKRTQITVVNDVRSRRGLLPIKHIADLYLRPPLVLATTAEPFVLGRNDWPDSVRCVGPIDWEPFSPEPDWVHQLDARPLIVVVGSSVREKGRARSWIRIALEALSTEPYQVVATVPNGDVPPGSYPHARIFRFVPHKHLLARAACVVCHGGSGITHKALAAGVPVVAIPFAYDRFDVASRVEASGAGVVVPGKMLTAERLRQAVKVAMSCSAGAAQVAAAFKQKGGAAAAASAIEENLRFA